MIAGGRRLYTILVQSIEPAGGLTRAQLVRALTRAWNRAAAFYAALAFLLVFARQLIAAVVHHAWAPTAITFGILVLFIAVSTVFALVSRGRSAASISPEAAEAIAAGLALAGMPVPKVVSVGPRPVVIARARLLESRNPTVSVGLPLLLAAPVEDLPVAAAYKLAITMQPYPVLAGALWRKRQRMEQIRDQLAEAGRIRSRRGRRVDGFLAATERFADDIRTRADLAAVTVAGGADQAAAALYRIDVVALEFAAFASRFVRLIVKKRRVPAHLYTGWHQVRQEGIAPWEQLPPSELDAFFAEHPALTLADREPLRRIPLQLRRGEAGSPAPCVVSESAERQLAKRMAKVFYSAKVSKPTPEDKLDLTLIYDAQPGDAAVLEAAGTILGRPATRADVLDLVLDDRLGELAAPLLGKEHDPDRRDGGLSRGLILALLVTGAQKEHGLLQLDPLRPRLLTGPDGDEFDVARHITAALESQQGVCQLRTLLT